MAEVKNIESAIKNTSFAEGFEIFTEIASKPFDVVNHNRLKLFMLGTENKLFNYDELYEYIYYNIASYVFDRKIVKEATDDHRAMVSIFGRAVDCLKGVENENDRGSGAELGEILLYLFLEQDLQSPKLFSKVELKTSAQDYIKGSDAIHYKIRTSNSGEKVVQLVVGEAKIYEKIAGAAGALAKAFESINTYLTDHVRDTELIDKQLVNQLVEPNEVAEIKALVLKKSPRAKRETVFGVFIGYTSPYKGETDDNDTFDKNIVEENKKHILSFEQAIIDEINKHKVSNYEFNFYFLPFHSAQNDRKHIIKLLKHKETQYTERGRNDE